MPDEVNNSVPMRETVKRSIIALHEKFNREHSEFMLLAAKEAGLDPNEWKPNTVLFTFERVKT